ncbi:SCO family protein [Sporosarcina sp. HYO08]|uniref:SCO family protein n=1 Tax=Sporosarcina sp. HYO08 TaxID=1759557 RepID=UPI00079642A6|nr:SCO family protein [Sporosarcina sp. HYO08]KXH81711.1 cysteine ABC transporter ATP-binding protein [Sporosarcina sp. HYO08]
MRKSLWLSVFMLISLLLSACSGGSFKADHKYEMEPFEFTNQHHETVSLDDLKGEVWLAQFVFTNCTSVCPPMMANLSDLSHRLESAGVKDYKVVSFSVDPKIDTPEVLQDYLDMFEVADESKWEMLTGFTQEKIAEIAAKSFKTVVIDDPNTDQVIHGTSFYLVNQQGEVVKTYNGATDVPYDQIISDMEALIKSGA